MDPFKRRKLGTSDVMVPQLGFGGAPLGELYVKISEADSMATVGAAWDGGIRYFDTAPWYGRGLSEHRMGAGLYDKPRDEFLISTKVGRVLHAPIPPTWRPTDWAGGLPFALTFDYGYDAVMRSFEDSLQRTRLTRLDILVIHDLDFWYHQTEPRVNAYLNQLATGGYRALAELKASGAIGAIGAGINETGMIPRFLDLVDLDFFLVALRYTLGEQSALESEIPRASEKGIGFIIGGVFSSGLYATGPMPGAKFNYQDASQEELDRAGKIKAICDRHGVPLAAAALQFPLHHPNVVSVIPGGFKPEHVTANIEAMRHPIPDALWAELKHEGLIRADAPTP
jgi:D-threo-aldose 1-dehydrogenase